MFIVNPSKNKSHITKKGIMGAGQEIKPEWMSASAFEKKVSKKDIIEVVDVEIIPESKPEIPEIVPEKVDTEQNKRGRKPKIIGGAVKSE